MTTASRRVYVCTNSIKIMRLISTGEDTAACKRILMRLILFQMFTQSIQQGTNGGIFVHEKQLFLLFIQSGIEGFGGGFLAGMLCALVHVKDEEPFFYGIYWGVTCLRCFDCVFIDRHHDAALFYGGIDNRLFPIIVKDLNFVATAVTHFLVRVSIQVIGILLVIGKPEQRQWLIFTGTPLSQQRAANQDAFKK